MGKHIVFLVGNSSTNAVFPIEILMAETELMVTQNYNFENRWNKKTLFGVIRL